MHDSFRDRIAGLIRDAVCAARDRGDTIYAASDDAAKMILDEVPTLSEGSDETPLKQRLEELCLKWRDDRAGYVGEQPGARFAYTAVELCERELRAVIKQS
jgi:hypothetical protein